LISSEETCLEKSVWLEHQVFLATKSEPMYKMKYMSKVNEDLFVDIENHYLEFLV
jgi:hypothetical protein